MPAIGQMMTFAVRGLEVEKIKYCPFCGEKAIMKKVDSESRLRRNEYYIECLYAGCRCRTPNQISEENAVYVWNKRI